MSEADQIRSWLQAEVEEHWRTTNSALLLSQIGVKLRKEFPDFAEQMPNGLKDFLVRWPIAHLGQDPSVTQKIGLVPLSVTLPINQAELFASSRSRPEHPSFVSTFWRAFTEPIKGKRFIYIDPAGEVGIEVQDIEPPALPRESGKEVLPTDLGPFGSDIPPEEKGKLTHQKIQDWLSRNKISSDAVRRLERGAVWREHNLAENIGRAFLEMSATDLARINIPMDVVINLLKKRGLSP